MHIITRKRIIDAQAKYPRCVTSLRGWYQILNKSDFDNFAALRNIFNSVDKVGDKFVFNICGNKLRLIAAIHFNTQKVFIRAVLSHSEYDKGDWK